jgi:hypothetical protein
METARETAQRVVNRLLGEETTTPAPKQESAPRHTSFRGPLRKPLPEARSGKGVPKAMKQGKKMAGKAVAGKPGKVSYRESLMKSVLEKLAVKKAMKQGKKMSGQMVAGKPGKVSYKGEALGKGSGMKGGSKAKKMLNTIAKKPGTVGYGKK